MYFQLAVWSLEIARMVALHGAVKMPNPLTKWQAFTLMNILHILLVVVTSLKTSKRRYRYQLQNNCHRQIIYEQMFKRLLA